jgi:uncharacterized protein YndB with AHSA1/START domain
MVSTDGEAAATASDREIVITRVFDAPRELVFEAWTDPERVVEWWGPRSFTTTMHEIDVRPGGVWRFTMHGPDGTDYANRVVFVEVVKPEHLVYNHGPEGQSDVKEFHVAATFDEEDGKTRITLRLVFDSAAERDRALSSERWRAGSRRWSAWRSTWRRREERGTL